MPTMAGMIRRTTQTDPVTPPEPSPGVTLLTVLTPTRSPYLRFYNRTGDSLTALTSTAQDLADAKALAWSGDGLLLAVCRTPNNLSIYRRSGQGVGGRWTSSDHTGSGPSALAWSPDGALLAVGATNSPYLTLFRRSGTTVVPAVTPTAFTPVSALAWSPDGTALAVGSTSTTKNGPAIYFRTGGTLDGGTLVLAAGAVSTALAWSADGTRLAAGAARAPVLAVYARTGAKTFTRVTPVANPGAVAALAWTPDSRSLMVATGTQLRGYDRTVTTYGSLTSTAQTLTWSGDGGLLAAGSRTAPHLTAYTWAGQYLALTRAPDPPAPGGAVTALAWVPGT